MKNALKVFMVTGLLVLTSSCEKDDTEAFDFNEDSLKVGSQSKKASKQESFNGTSRATSASHSASNGGYGAWVGEILEAEDGDLFEKWAESLSRNPSELQLRQQQLVHMRRAEVITWSISDQDLEPIEAGDEPRAVEIPFFGKETITVFAEKIRRFGAQSIHLQGYLASDPESKVSISLSDKAPIATIESPESLYYYESFEDVVILREVEPGSQHADSNCYCEGHQAEP